VAHGAAAFRGAAAAGTGAAEAVIDGELFSGPDFLEAVKEDLAAELAHRQIRITAVIDELGAAAAHRAIDLPAPVEAGEVGPLRLSRLKLPNQATHAFPLADSFADVLDDPFAAWDRHFREDTEALDSRTAYVEWKAGELGIDAWNVSPRGHLNISQKRGCQPGWQPRSLDLICVSGRSRASR
jgi:hypothetical protein